MVSGIFFDPVPTTSTPSLGDLQWPGHHDAGHLEREIWGQWIPDRQ